MMQKARTDLPLGGEDGLPEGNSPIRTVCFTGHRQIDPAHAVLLPALLDAAIRELYGRGARVFRAGGAIGFDTVAALKVLDLTPVLPGLELELILPCRDQTSQWNVGNTRTYDYILSAATRSRFLFDHYMEGCMLERDRQLVQGSDVCVAYCARSRGGTAYTCALALREGLELINLYERIQKRGKKDRL